ncbi:YoaK family protein [Halioxenophilus sp. WMMB6]|uniref:YoaK family protein n=1 Tax=Halioxenophilus sp. WMMB6 TaxID=3073815 RepID=UPI00295E2D21|nr:YoaK family protein [Halioxenophilus sp. WMMB6]
MIKRLPKWVEYGAFVLALVAGSVNAIGLLGFEHQSVSHLSGTATLVGTGITHGQLGEVLHLLGVLLAFLVGAAVSGFLLTGSRLKLGRHYDTLLVLEAALLFLAIPALNNQLFFGHYLASMACGLQNALATSYSGAILRTTHLTGIFTDLGIMLGSFLRGGNFDRRKAVLFILIILGFITGGVVGALLYGQWHFAALGVPGAICLLLAAGYRLYSRLAPARA